MTKKDETKPLEAKAHGAIRLMMMMMTMTMGTTEVGKAADSTNNGGRGRHGINGTKAMAQIVAGLGSREVGRHGVVGETMAQIIVGIGSKVRRERVWGSVHGTEGRSHEGP